MLKRLRRYIRDYFGFTKTETNGLLVLVPLMFFFLFAPTLYTSLFSIQYDAMKEDRQLMDSLLTVWEPQFEKATPENPENLFVIESFPFNPNSAGLEDLTRLGISNRIAQRIINYRNKSGVFRIKSDLKKIYDFPDSVYQRLEEFIQLPSQRPKPVAKSENPVSNENSSVLRQPMKDIARTESESPEILGIDLNQADTTELRKLRGIGPAYSRRIIKYRQLLGGFVSVNQLREVYGLSDSLVKTLEPHVFIDDDFQPKKLNLNIMTFKEINRHPYLSFEQTKAVMRARSNFGKFEKQEDLNRMGLPDSVVRKLSVYIEFSND